MKTHTQTAQFACSPKALFDFMSNVENLPKWAKNYMLSLRKEGNDYIATTPAGDMYQIFTIHEASGTIDMQGGPTKDQLWTWPCRVTSDNLGGSILSFTCIQMPDQPDDEFDQQCSSLKEEFTYIKELVE